MSATTLSLVVIFVPVAFIHGVMGRFLNTFGLTMAFAIMVSLVVAFTLTPMLCSRFLVRRGKRQLSRANGGSSRRSKSATSGTAWSLDHRWVVVLATVLVASIPVLVKIVGGASSRRRFGEFAVESARRPAIRWRIPTKWCARSKPRLRGIPEVRHLLTTVGDTTGDERVTVAEIVAILAPIGQRSRSQGRSGQPRGA